MSYPNLNGVLGYCYQYDATLLMKHLVIGYEEYQVCDSLYSMRFVICLYTKELDIMAIMDHIFEDNGMIICCFEVISATRVQTPETVLNHFPNYVALITILEETSNLLMEGLATAEIFGWCVIR